MKIALASDHAGYLLKEQIKNYLDSRLLEYEDFGTHNEESTDYPRYAELVAKAIQSHSFDLGILICGTGVGMSIAANKFNGIRAVVCSEPYSAIMARRHNNANVLCIGARVVAGGLATLICEGWLNAAFEGDRHQRRLDIITRIEQRNSLPGISPLDESAAKEEPQNASKLTDEPKPNQDTQPLSPASGV